MCTTDIVTVTTETITIPTYKACPPEISPLFIENRVYQGSSGKVYPLPVIEKLSDSKEDVPYQAVTLENQYLRVMILPEIGGRIQRAYDKTNGYDFVYYNHVIKPALVGLAGPWISGGIEFNWPQHHRPTTFSPVDFKTMKNPDGSCSVYVGETDPMNGTKGMACITLYPGKAYIEIKGQLYNPTDYPQSFLWWANPAVAVNDHTYSVFPPDVHYVMDHGKRAVASFPIATGEYYKFDYSAGVDISRYKNVVVPTSYMAESSAYDFVGNYDESLSAGMLHVANHHVSPGKKQWTWGNGDFGRSWDRNLTETDGPYIELMAGVFTDNQPDFTWLKPHEEKIFTQYFMPYKGVGRVSNATHHAVIGLDIQKTGTAGIRVYTTADYDDAKISVTQDEEVLYTNAVSLSPNACFSDEFRYTGNTENLCITVSTKEGGILCVYKKQPAANTPVPSPASPLPKPADIKTTEELYLAALHLEQYRHATRNPVDYYKEGLYRDPTDIRLNNGYGLIQLKSGYITESIKHFETAVRKQTQNNPNPFTGDCCYHLGLALEKAGRDDEAFDAFYKSTWSAETQSSGFYRLACLSIRKKDYAAALAFTEQSLIRNWHNMNARVLKAAILRQQNLTEDAYLNECVNIDPLHMGIRYEIALHVKDMQPWLELMRDKALNYIELAHLYMQSGAYADAMQILSACPEQTHMTRYIMAYAADCAGDTAQALASIRQAEEMTIDVCNPGRLEDMLVLQRITALDAHTPHAQYYLGNLYYDRKRYADAIVCWENAVALQPDFALAHRNLSIAYYNRSHNGKQAMEAIQRACELMPLYPRMWLEQDQLAAKLRHPLPDRLQVLQSHMKEVESRDDLLLRYITLLNLTGQHDTALRTLLDHRFHPWEGGEGKVSAQYKYALISLARAKITQHAYEDALALLQRSLQYPETLGEGKLPNTPDNQAYYYMAVSYQGLDMETDAQQYFTMAAAGDSQPVQALYYNDPPSDYIFYQGLALRALGNHDAADKVFETLREYGQQHRNDSIEYDYFAVSLPEIEVYQEDLFLNQQQYCAWMRALGETGLGRYHAAEASIAKILAKQPDHAGALELQAVSSQLQER